MSLGLLVLPPLGYGLGAFATAADSAAFFSWATLRGAPLLAGLGVLSVLAYPAVVKRRPCGRVLLVLANVAAVWAVAAGFAWVRLG